MSGWLGPWQWPETPFESVLLVGAPLALLLFRGLFSVRRRRLVAGLLAVTATALSVAYLHHYLRGGPRIIDATAYYLEGRTLGAGMLSMPLPSPETAVLGRFLLRSDALGTASASVIFPPGYPALLAVGFRLGAPLTIGPLLAAAIVVATMALGRRLVGAELGPGGPNDAAGLALAAGLFSTLCAALRYHTADTMSHGLAALLVATGLVGGWAAVERARSPLGAPALPALGGGFCLGWLAATRPASAVALGATLLLLGASRLRGSNVRRTWTLVACFVIGALPGIALYVAYQQAATGSVFGSAQLAYYARSDGPPGCFGWGFGRSVGCLGEHGDVVPAGLPRGFFLAEALATTGRRLYLHLGDVLGFRPLFWLVPLGAVLGRRNPLVRWCATAAVMHIVVYAGFYYDGNYPGGGARMYADIIPLEHALAAYALAALLSRATTPRPAARARAARLRAWASRSLRRLLGGSELRTLAAGTAALGLVGFAGHEGRLHAQLRDREGGEPMFDARLLADHGIERGLVFVDTDHGFDLGRSPVPDAPLEIVRAHGDDLDWLTWRVRGSPPAYRYRYLFDWKSSARGRHELEAVDFGPRTVLTIEAENLWPAREQRAGWVWPSWDAACASAGRYLLLHPSGPRAEAVLALPVELAPRRIEPVVVVGAGLSTERPVDTIAGELRLVVDGAVLARWELPAASAEPRCMALAAAPPLPTAPASVTLELEGSTPVALDCLHAR